MGIASRRFSRTSALADVFVPIRAGRDIVFLGALINYVLTQREGLPRIRGDLHQRRRAGRRRVLDTEDLDGLFSGYDPERRKYDPSTWHFAGAKASHTVGPQREAE